MNYDNDSHLTVLVTPRKEDRDKIAGYLATKKSGADTSDSFKALNRKLVSMCKSTLILCCVLYVSDRSYSSTDKELQAGQERMQAKLMQQGTELEE